MPISKKISQAFIFAAGRGERMRPLTNQTPKPLLLLKNRAIIDYSLEKLLAIPSIKRIVVNGFYLADEIKNHLNKFNDSRIIFSHETSKIETGGGLLFAKSYLNPAEPLLTINGDVAWRDEPKKNDIELIYQHFEALRENFDKENQSKIFPKILLGLKKCEDYFGYEANEFGGGDFDLIDGRLKKKEGKMSHAYVGLQVLDLSVLNQAPKLENKETAPCFSMNFFYKNAADSQTGLLEGVYGCELSGRYFHLGNPQTLAEAQKVF